MRGGWSTSCVSAVEGLVMLFPRGSQSGAAGDMCGLNRVDVWWCSSVGQ